MDLFHVETGAVPGQSCSEETMPILKRSPIKDEPQLNSKVFLINDSLASVANMTLMFVDPSTRSKDYPSKPTSPVKQKDNERDPPKSPEYRQLSPKNLEDPIYPSSKTILSVKCSSNELENLLEKTNNNLNISEKRASRSGASLPEQPSTSLICQSGNSIPGSGKKKTLGELAKEWNANQSPDEKKDVKVDKAVVSTFEDDESLSLDPLLVEKLTESPDTQLIRHHEYHSPHESKIAAAMRLSQEKISHQAPVGNTHGAKTMTLAELASLSPKSKEQSTSSPTLNSAAPRTTSRSSVPSLSTYPLSPPHTSTPEEGSSHMDKSTDSLVRHSEFYKGSANVIRRPSSESQLSFQAPRERGGSTLSDLIQQGNTDDDSLLGSDLSANKDWMGSRESIYSNDGIYGNHDVSGEILLSYQYFKGSFKVKIFEARGLSAVDKTHDTSNPYVKVYLLPDQSRTGKRKTKMKHATLDPEFNEEMLYKISTADLLRRTVWISIWHYDRFGRNEFLGEVRIPLGNYQGNEVAPNWYPLLPAASKPSENDQGELVVALMYSPADKKRKSGLGAGKVYVKIIEAKNLPGKDADGLSDPFCKSYLLPDPQKKSKRKTPVKKRNLNPRWDYKFSYDNLTIDDLQHRVLELTVWDHDLGTSNDFLGGVRIGLGTSDNSWDDCTGEEVTLWQFLLSKPNTWAESTLPLRSEMSSRKGLRT